MKKVLTLFICALLSIGAKAQTVVESKTQSVNKLKAAVSRANASNIQAVKIYLKNGKSVVYSFSENPVITFANDKIKWQTNTASTSYSFSEFDHYELVSATDGIENIEADYKFSSNGNIVSIKGISDNDRIAVYDISGRVQNDCIDKNGSEATINLQSKPNGVYIIKLNNTNTYKIVKQ